MLLVLYVKQGFEVMTIPARTATFALLAAGLALGACNTISGAGKDLSSAGKAITKTADDVKN